jgi:hypothetical protein
VSEPDSLATAFVVGPSVLGNVSANVASVVVKAVVATSRRSLGSPGVSREASIAGGSYVDC